MTRKFTELDLDANLQRGIADAGFIQCMPVQEKTFTHALKYTDICVQSQTGTGKTAVFLISIYHNFLNKRDLKNSKALIIAPTRELAIQIEKEAKIIGKYLDFTCGCFYGGVGYADQEKLLKDGVDIIIGTPGRLIDFHQQKKLDLRKTGFLVIDEADRLFDMGFLPDIKKMLKNSIIGKSIVSTDLATEFYASAAEYQGPGCQDEAYSHKRTDSREKNFIL